MTRNELARLLDHSVLKPESTEMDIIGGAEITREWRIGFYCVQSSWVKRAVEILAGTDASVVSVIGFPHGCEPAQIKARAALLAVADGAAEIDMVINVGWLRSGFAQAVADDIAAVVRAIEGTPVKVILESTALTTEEKLLACKLAVDAGAAFVKTSTGFGPGGATVEDVALMRRTVGPDVGVKAAGGIRTREQAEAMVLAGASRLGASSSIQIVSGG